MMETADYAAPALSKGQRRLDDPLQNFKKRGKLDLGCPQITIVVCEETNYL